MVARCLGWDSRGVTVAAGTHRLGCARYAPPPLPDSAWDGFDAETPFAAWNPQIRSHFETDMLACLAGELAELMLAPPRAGRQMPTVADQAAEQVEALAALPEPPPADVAVIRKTVDTPGQSDTETIAKLVWAAHGPDLAAGSAWLGWMEAACRSLILARRAEIERIAALLTVRHTLTGQQVAALLRE